MPTFLKESASGEVFELKDFTLIGRGEGMTVRLRDSNVSRQHATIRREGVNYWLVDLGSANGSYVNDVALTSARTLCHGDRIQFGNSVLVFQKGEFAEAQDPPLSEKTAIPLNGTPAPKSVNVTLFVADLKDFTGISAMLSPNQLADLLSEWYADCHAILGQYGASIDKFIGDSVFAYWHGTDADTRVRALSAAVALRAVEIAPTSNTRVLLRAQHNIQLDCRIGMHIGTVAMGPMGKGISTALGDAVNIAFGIEALTRVVGQPALVSAAFLEGWDQGRQYFDSCGHHKIKGRGALIEVFALRQASGTVVGIL
ncbi:adenylate/guanylate cyclase domain-containing protein [Bradyrhizobium sp. AUGA SZCCT0182]|uniref:adenylate/guanylate cyclase domain-containing protein n=1 Tax=Bradyrhizobium sp. AUGA SZCCT0182 TaxID=2807667 RepID=UPI001BACBA1D|nr:adenylate/guanylate cyclase domain-containing protein [Bradyrhizobium sp. AUGA SZCCT0182]MBR1232052.1 adenylate/guanylate cyclase domain-containing protein [Bradyrhizobium sp. AUGA SZCCT0182]